MSDVIQFSWRPKVAQSLTLDDTTLSHTSIRLSDLYNGIPSGSGLVCSFDTFFDPEAARKPPSAEQSQGWSNQELSDLYRAHRLMALAGISTEIDCGLTDEGDPWFVFMDNRNEVFVHFSRYDGAYMVSSQVHDKPIWGDSLAELVVKFSELLRLASKNDPDRQNVVSIARRSNDSVLVHPAAALAALVWSIYLLSDDLAAAIPSIPTDFEDYNQQVDLPGTPTEIAILSDLPNLAQKSMAAVISAMFTKHNIVVHHDREVNFGLSISNLASNQSMKAVGLGLSLAALSVGLPLFNAISKEAPLDVEKTSEKASHDTSIEDIKAAIMLVEASLKVFQQNHAEQPNTSYSESLIVEHSIDINADTASSIDLHDSIHAIPAGYTTYLDQISYLPKKSAASTLHIQFDYGNLFSIVSESPNALHGIDAIITNSIVQRFSEAFESAVLTSIETLSVSEFTQMVTINGATELIELLNDPLHPTQYAVFDDQVRLYLDHLLQTYTNIRIVALQNEIIFINLDAFATASIEDPIYARSWSFEDGGTISTVGLKSDMEMFDSIS